MPSHPAASCTKSFTTITRLPVSQRQTTPVCILLPLYDPDLDPVTLILDHDIDIVSEYSLKSHLTHNRSFQRRVFPGNWLHWYWQPKTSKQNIIYTWNTRHKHTIMLRVVSICPKGKCWARLLGVGNGWSYCVIVLKVNSIAAIIF